MTKIEKIKKVEKVVFKEPVLIKLKPDNIKSTLFPAGSEVPKELLEREDLYRYFVKIEVEKKEN